MNDSHKLIGRIAALETLILSLIATHPNPEKVQELFSKMIEKKTVASMYGEQVSDDFLQEFDKHKARWLAVLNTTTKETRCL